MGWKIEETKKAIMEAHTFWQRGTQYQQWEWHQQQLKNNAFWYNSTSRYIQCVHYYYREFPKPGEDEGRITHTILINPEDNQTTIKDSYLFQRVGRFEHWNQIVHPMYYDNDGGGYHHSVTGLGQKMYSAMEYQNRLICNIADKAFAPKILFRPLTAADDQKMNIVQYAEYGKVPSGYEVVQTPVQSFMEEGVAFNRELTSLISSNLAQYRTALSREGGNPITAYEAQMRASDQSKLGRTQLNHYYNQLDWLYEEKFRRATNPKLNGFMPGGRDAVKFRNACLNRGVPMQALRKIKGVRASRTVGQGSQFMRQQTSQQILSISSMLPESGRMNAISDYIAALAGQSMVNRYAPKTETPQAVDQLSMATLQIAAAKEGVSPVVGGSQNHYIYARAFLQAGVEALQSVQQGANPVEVVGFIQTIGPALIAHIAAMQSDPSRQAEAKEMLKQATQLEAMAKQLQAKVQQQQQAAARQQQQLQQRQAQMNSEQQLDAAEVKHKLAMSEAKTKAALEQKAAKNAQSMAIADAQSASKIQRANMEALADTALKARETAEVES